MRATYFLGAAGLAVVGMSGAALAADVYVPTPAHEAAYASHPGLVGKVGVWGGWLWRTGNAMNDSGGSSEDESLPVLGVNAAIASSLAPMFIGQVDLDAEAAFSEGGGDNYRGSVVGGAHLAYGTLAGSSIGVFGAVGITADEDSPDQDATLWALGLEGRTAVGHVTLLGQAGYLDSSAEDPEQFGNAWFVRGVARSALNGGRTFLEGELSYASGFQDHDSSEPDATMLIGWGLELEHEISQSAAHRVSGFVRYDGLYFDEDSDSGDRERIVDHLIKAGVRVAWGGQALGGDVPFSLPRFGHWVGGATALD